MRTLSCLALAVPLILAVPSAAGGLLYRLVHECAASARLLILTEGLQSREPGALFDSTTRREEASRGARVLGLPSNHVEVLPYRDCHLHECGHDLIKEIESRIYQPDGSPQ